MSNSTDKRYLYDTNAMVAQLNDNEEILEHLNAIDQIYIPTIALGELYFGAEKSQKRDDNFSRISRFLQSGIVLICDAETAHWYGQIAMELRRKGRPIPQNDIWIAAVALQHELILLTRDAHFENVDNLTIEGW